jgi:hyaluronan synthase
MESSAVVRLLPIPWISDLLERFNTRKSTPFPRVPGKKISEHKEKHEDTMVDAIEAPSGRFGNFIGCIIAALLYYYLTLHWSEHLYTFDTIQTIFLAEYCGWSNEKARSRSLRLEHEAQEKLSLAEKGDLSENRLDCIAAVVGYREDPSIFTKALESYSNTKGCRFVLIGIDGNGAKDQVMVDIFQKVKHCST